ncbi:MAG: sugar phosphate isomerase/epimerase [Planctomycetes bacterium]|nr:sugar phosphate isomerase/epimerase [Planctomycetota bacterium]
MKTGMNLLLWTTHVTEKLFPLFAKLKATGFDGVEIPLFDGDAKHYAKIAAELRNQGLRCTTVTVVGPDSNPISPDAKVRKAAVDRHKWAIEMTATLGGENLCGPYHSPLAVFSGKPPTDSERKRCAAVCRKSAEFAKKHNVMMCIEYLNRFECYFLTTAAQAKDLVKAVDHPNFRTMYDTFHANIEEKNAAATIKALFPCFGHVHISESDRGTPGTGMVHWDETFKALREVKYDGWLVIESFGRALPDLAAATKVWRDLFRSPEEVYTKGMAFMKSKWSQFA